MKRIFLIALVLLSACTGTKGEHDPVALIVATENSNGQHALQLIETKNLQALVGSPLVVHDSFTKTYPAGTNIVQLLSPGQQRAELWVLYGAAGEMYIDVYEPSTINLGAPAPLDPSRTIHLGAGNPVGFSVHGNKIAVRAGDDLYVFDEAGNTHDFALTITDPLSVAPVFIDGEAYFWSEGSGSQLELVHIGGFPKLPFGPIGHRPPAVTADMFVPEIIVHVGANGHVALFDPATSEPDHPATTTVSDLGTAEGAVLVGSRLLVRTSSALEQVAVTYHGALEAQLVARDSLRATDVVVQDPYNQYAYALRAGDGDIISTLGSVDPGNDVPSLLVQRQVPLPSLLTPFAGEAFIVTSGQ